jgi:hypothetical protein
MTITATTRGTKITCKGCNEEIHFINSQKTGKPIPCNLGAVTVVTRDGQTVQGFIPHFATCPKAADFRKAGKKDGK